MILSLKEAQSCPSPTNMPISSINMSASSTPNKKVSSISKHASSENTDYSKSTVSFPASIPFPPNLNTDLDMKYAELYGIQETLIEAEARLNKEKTRLARLEGEMQVSEDELERVRAEWQNHRGNEFSSNVLKFENIIACKVLNVQTYRIRYDMAVETVELWESEVAKQENLKLSLLSEISHLKTVLRTS